MHKKNMSNSNYIRYKSYKEIYSNAEALGSSIIRLNLAPKQKEHLDYELGFVAIQSKNREEYLTIELACGLYGTILKGRNCIIGSVRHFGS